MDIARELERLNFILGLPLHQKCEDLQKLLNDCSFKEMQMVYPRLLESIFGTTDNSGWGLHSTYKELNLSDYTVLYNFLHPRGPVFSTCYRLISDTYLRYDFPVANLPVSLRHIIEDGGVPPFYVGKIQMDPRTRARVSVALNPFELYMTYFATHLTNPRLQLRRPPEVIGGSSDSVYLQLAEEYFAHFLPCSPSAQVLPHVEGPALAVPLVRHVPARPADTPTIFRQSVLNQTNASTSLHSTSVIQQNAPVDIWRSETVIQIFVDIWLAVGATDSLQLSPIRERGLPMDHVRAVRGMAKHFHFFSNSITADMSAMDELKRVVWDAVAAKVYLFLKHCMQHWPSDGSFRWVIEMWLSCIQPWRYADYRNARSNDGKGVVCDIRLWTPFLAENLPAYTAIFHQLLRRFYRLDLPLIMNAVMLYRVTKVFCQPALIQILINLENSFDSTSDNSGSVVLKITKWQGTIKQQQYLTEFDNYEPLFSDIGVSKVTKFVDQLARSIKTARLLAKEAQESSAIPDGVFSSFFGFFTKTSTNDKILEDRRMVIAYLELSLQHLCTAFKIAKPDTYLPRTANPVQNITSPQRPIRSPNSRDGKQKRIEYQGAPELQPIQSSEIAKLVKIFHQISSKLNEMYGSQFAAVYWRPSVLGRVAQQILLPPQAVQSYKRNTSGTRQFPILVAEQLPPRISLRRLARRELLLWTCLGVIGFWFFGYGPFTFPLLILFVWMLLIFLRALLTPRVEASSRNDTPADLLQHFEDPHDLSTSF